MGSRNLFLKSRTPFYGRWWFLTLALLAAALTYTRFSKQRSLDELAWQPPVEPQGVTIVSQPSEVPLGTSKEPVATENTPPAVTAQAAASEAPPVTSTAATTVRDDSAQIRKTLERWSQAWSARDVDAYLAQYSPTFVPAAGQNRATWAKVRRQRILSKTEIAHEIRDLELTVEGDKATARFEQMYAADQIRQVGPKTLRLSREGSNWLIISEKSN